MRDEKEPAREGGAVSTLRRKGLLIRDILRTLEILLLIGYGTLLATSRTNGFRTLLGRQIEDRLGGGSVTIGTAKLTPAFHLILGEIRVRWPKAAGEEVVHISAAEVYPDWLGWFGGFRLKKGSMEGVHFLFSVTDAGTVVPSFGQDMTRWLHQLGWITPEIDLQAAGGDPELWRMLDAPVQIQNMNIQWVSARGVQGLRMEGIQGEVRPLHLERHAFRYVDLTANRVIVENGATIAVPPLHSLLAPDRMFRLYDLSVPEREPECTNSPSPRSALGRTKEAL